MLERLASEENQNAKGTSLDFELTREETEELKQTGYVVTGDYCIVEMDGEVTVYRLFTEWSSLNYAR